MNGQYGKASSRKPEDQGCMGGLWKGEGGGGQLLVHPLLSGCPLLLLTLPLSNIYIS